MKDYYSILGISEYATTDEIKTAFRSLMRIWHPDVCARNDANEKFVEIVEAYEILYDQHKREAYDERRHETVSEQPEEPPTTLLGCLGITFLIIICLSFVAYIAFKVYTTLHGVQTIDDSIMRPLK